MRELFSEIYRGYRQFTGTGAVVVLFIVAVAVIILFYRARNRKITPVILSVGGSIAFVAASVWDMVTMPNAGRRKNLAARLFAALVCVLAITLSGTSPFTRNISEKAENDMHLPSFVPEAAEAVIGDGTYKTILTMPGWGDYFKSYSSAYSVVSPDEDDAYLADEDMRTLYTQLIKVHPDMKKVASGAHRMECGYVILSDGIWQDIPLTDLGYELIYETEGCRVYREVRTP